MTRQWAVAAYTEQAADEIATFDEGTDGWLSGTSPMPKLLYGNQDYHFDGTRGAGKDTRLTIFDDYMAEASVGWQLLLTPTA